MKREILEKLLVGVFGASCLLVASPALAVPTSLTHQGKLFDMEGKPVSGTKAAKFTVYDSQTQGAILWQGEVMLTLAADGSFTAILGDDQNPLDEKVFTGERLWLEMSIDDEALLPRLAINSAPYALRAKSLNDGAVTLSSLAPGLLDWSNIQNPPADALTSLGCATAGQVPTWDGAAWSCASPSVDEATVDGFVANNGYVEAAACASAGQVLSWSGSAWTCVAQASLTEAQVDAFVANNGYIEANPCASAGQVLSWNGNAWACVAQTNPLTEAQVDAFVANNGYLTGPLTDATVPDAISISNTRLHAPAGAGQVGIGTTTTTAALTVEGDLHLTRGATRTIGIPDAAFGGVTLNVRAGGFAASNGTGGNGGNLILQGGNSNLSQGSAACPADNSGGGDIELRPGYNVTTFVCGQKRSGHIVFYAGDGPNQPEVMRIYGDRGNVGIGTNAPNAAYKLHVVGAAAATNFVTLSDRRYKEHITPITDALSKLQQLRGVTYDWRRDQYPEMNFEQKTQLGFIAQELKEVLPEAVRVDEDGVHRVDYNKVVPVLVEGVKSQQAHIDALKLELAQTKAQQDALETRLAAVEKRQALIDVTPRQAGMGGVVFLLILGFGAGLRRRLGLAR